MTTKKCRTCGESKPLTDFWRYRVGRELRRPTCKMCVKSRRNHALYTPVYALATDRIEAYRLEMTRGRRSK